MRALLRLLVALLALLVLVALVVATWLGYATMKRSQRERTTIESLAPPTGRWVDVGDARLFVQEWGPPGGPAPNECPTRVTSLGPPSVLIRFSRRKACAGRV